MCIKWLRTVREEQENFGEQLRNSAFNNVGILSIFSAAPLAPTEKIKGDTISLNFYSNQTKPSTS